MPVVVFPVRNYVHEALELFAEVAEALDYAHQQGVVHRDIKPSNLLLAPDGHLMIADFGLAKIGNAGSITRTGDLLGSPSYMSPEQTQTRRMPVDHRTDIWSLGVTLYEFLTLRHPFEARTLELSFRNIASEDPKPARKLNPRLPKDVEIILQKALEKNPDHRYQSAGELAADLRCVLNYESIQARSISPVQRSFRFVRRNSTPIALTLLSVTLLAVGAMAFSLLNEKKMRDLELGFAFFEWMQGEKLASAKTVDEIQSELRRLRKESPSMSAAVDKLAMQTIGEAKSHLPTSRTAGDLEAAMQSLVKIRLIHLHDPDEEARQRLKLDRATAEVRVRLVWTIADTLLDQVPGTPTVDSERLWQWLLHFVGTEGPVEGLDVERNPLVRRNAVAALARLSRHSEFGDRVVPELCRVVREANDEPGVQCEAVKTLARIDVSVTDGQTLQALETMLSADEYFDLPTISRYRATEILAGSPDPGQFEALFRQLLADPAIAVRELAEQTLKA